ncbi:NAD(P)-dependent oxidoreductase [Martelella alba]|uniref:NAD(P)-dependent oxidoreductase n=1 Tax=Martelella alba TaxID=2590451 RepID=A0A506UAC7_9HYPH|nr:NAD(P)-dependent oxidoreductase [Martelella alba]TPW30024.1 NAD(P)-dependent oxidoreductase [Martelella alba]
MAVNWDNEMLTVAFIGTGLMGAPMAKNLLKAGFSVTVWNRSRAKAEALVPFGARLAETPEEAVAAAEVVITMLSDGPAVADFLFAHGVAAKICKGATVIDMSSIRPAEARDHAERLAALGIYHIDAPVSGGTKGAEDGRLAIMAGGEAGHFEPLMPLFSAMGQAILLGPAGSGQLAKLANQAIVAITIGAVAEATLMVREGGIDPAAFRAVLKGGFADSVILQQHGKRMQDGDFVPGGRTVFQLKDLENVLSECREMGLELPLTTLQRDRFADLVERLDGGDLDHSALFLQLLDCNHRR